MQSKPSRRKYEKKRGPERIMFLCVVVVDVLMKEEMDGKEVVLFFWMKWKMLCDL